MIQDVEQKDNGSRYDKSRTTFFLNSKWFYLVMLNPVLRYLSIISASLVPLVFLVSLVFLVYLVEKIEIPKQVRNDERFTNDIITQ